MRDIMCDLTCDCCGKTDVDITDTFQGFLCEQCYELYESIYGTSNIVDEKLTKPSTTCEDGIPGQ